MKRALSFLLSLSFFFAAAYLLSAAKKTYVGDAPIRARIESIKVGPAAKAADEALAKAVAAKRSYCATEGVRCSTYGGAVRVDTATGEVVSDSGVDEFDRAINTAETAQFQVSQQVRVHESGLRVREGEFQLQLMAAIACAALCAYSSFKAAKAAPTLSTLWAVHAHVQAVITRFFLGPKTSDASKQEVSQDERDRRELEQLRERTLFLENRLAARSYREPDRTVRPV